MSIVIQIDRLVLEGIDLPAGQRSTFQSSVEAELVRLLAAAGVSSDLASGRYVPSMRAGTITLNEPDPARLAVEVARAVFSGIGG